MIPEKPLPFSDEFSSTEEYIESLLQYVTTSTQMQTLCGGVHVMDFFTSEPSIFYAALPDEWHSFILKCDPMKFLDFLLRQDLENITSIEEAGEPPASFVQYVKD